jgi:integrase
MRFQIGKYWLSQRAGSKQWCRTFYSDGQTNRVSLRTDDFEVAKQRLAEWVTLNGNIQQAKPEDIPIATLFARYYKSHASALPSADVTKRALNKWLDYYAGATVGDLTVRNQESFITYLMSQNYKRAFVKRIITTGKAALNFAYKRQEIASLPYILTVVEDEPEHSIASKENIAALFNAATAGDTEFMYLLLALCTCGRPEAVLGLGMHSIDKGARIINLLPPDRSQNKKRRPKLPIVDTLWPWVQECNGETFVNYKGRKIANNKKSFGAMCERAGVYVTRYTLRHTMATELRKRGVPYWEVEGWLGHRLKSTSERYAVFDPSYLGEGKKAIDAYFDELRPLIKYQF